MRGSAVPVGHPSTPTGFRGPLTLDGRYVRLVPLDRSFVPELARAGAFPEIWAYFRSGDLGTPEKMAAHLEYWRAAESRGEALQFVTLQKPTLAPVGGTGYLDIHRDDRGVEIGNTWLTPRLWRTPANTETKLLLLSHAFDVEGCVRVQLKTDERNVRSQRAIERLGAKREGVLRHHIRTADGTWRSSVYYSILAEEWPEVRARLEKFLERDWAPADRHPPTSG
jgi:N-acetyltransferase